MPRPIAVAVLLLVVSLTAGTAWAQREWGRTLLHEFVHAYLNRYRTNGRIPRWLNEGIAEYICSFQF